MSTHRSSASVLMLYLARDDRLRNAIAHHLRVLDYGACAPRVVYYNAKRGAPGRLGRWGFDAIVLHTTFLCMRWSSLFYPWKKGLEWIARSGARKIALPQDEYDHSEVLDEWLYELGVDTIFTTLGENVRAELYPLMHSRATFVKALTGYVDDGTTRRLAGEMLPARSRPVDIVYRASHLPYWFGSHGQLKHEVGDVVRERALELGMSVDISTRAADTITGDDWPRFLASGRTVIGAESGSSVLDRRGEIRARIQALLRADPRLSFDDVDRQMPAGWDDHRFFALSPRHFEAIASRTCQVLVEGHYDGVLVPDRHYIPLRRDFGNLDDVLEKVRDTGLVSMIAEQAFSDIVSSGKFSYRAFASALEEAVGPPRSRRQPRLGVTASLALTLESFAAARPTAWATLHAAPPATVARGFAVLGLSLRHRSLRRLLREVRHPRPPLSRVRGIEDVFRLGLLLRSARGGIRATDPFTVTVGLDPAGTLLLRTAATTGGSQPGEKGLDEAAVSSAIKSGRVKAIVWDHPPEEGVYRFEGIAALLSDRAEVVADAFADVLRTGS